MKKMIVASIIMFVLPLMANSAIKFHIKQVSDPSHASHQTRAVIIINDVNNSENVAQVGGYDALHGGLLVGQEVEAKWQAGWIFRNNISSYYQFYNACNVDGVSLAEPSNFKLVYIADNTSVDVILTCPLTKQGSLLTPKIEIHQKSQ